MINPALYVGRCRNCMLVSSNLPIIVTDNPMSPGQ